MERMNLKTRPWTMPIMAMVLTAMLVGCATIPPQRPEKPPVLEGRTFSNDHFDKILDAFVNNDGRVDYSALKEMPEDLEAYYRRIAYFSPDSHPQLFPDDNHRLAYWINAYNTAAIKTVLTYYPIQSVLDVKTPLPFFFLSDKAGFFFFQRLSFGGRTTSLYYLENKVIRKRFKDPRIHFALNCAAAGCPRLPRQAFSGRNLDRQLDGEARRFLSEARNFRIDPQDQAIYLSSIFKWYEKDFTQWYGRRHPGKKADLLNYIGLYLPRDRRAELEKIAGQYQVRFITYDWRLNDQATAP